MGPDGPNLTRGGAVRPDVRRWFERRTWRASAYTRAELLAAKGATSVSVVLPALDEEQTVGEIVAAIRRAS